MKKGYDAFKLKTYVQPIFQPQIKRISSIWCVFTTTYQSAWIRACFKRHNRRKGTPIHRASKSEVRTPDKGGRFEGI